ncbi:FG-GAP-like repeat-containing protein [Marinicella sp. W31]|uniref:FG-GAP-like repeat-containing protein n=1 Tax=Marinicella sp. W31 TaxID=3023713 RepID=UPI003757B124
MLALSFSASAQILIIPGTGTGAIPDSDPGGLTIEFDTGGGITGPIQSVSLNLTMDHTFVGDLEAELTAPNNISSIAIFGRTGYSRSGTVGQNVNLGGDYEFFDTATDDWWAAAEGGGDTDFVIPSGTYRSTTKSLLNGFTPLNSFGGCSTRMDGAFSGLDTSRSIGIWRFTIRDLAGGDLGSVTAATLTISQGLPTSTDLIFASGFDYEQGLTDLPVVTGNAGNTECSKAQFDYTGSGLTSYAIVNPVGDDFEWQIQDNDGTTTGALQSFIFGRSLTDFLIDGDVDGDGIKDVIVWRPLDAETAHFFVRRSSRPTDKIIKVRLGGTGDSPPHVGDYDGDGFDDLTVFQTPVVAGPTNLLIRDSSTGSNRPIALVDGTAFTLFPTGGMDYTGDGIADVSIQRTDPNMAGAGEHLIYNGNTGSFVESFTFGNNTDLLMPGNQVGSKRADTVIGRNEGSARVWYVRNVEDGMEELPVTFGVGTDFVLGGDYDGDGFDDKAVFRRSNTPGETKFIIRRSSDDTEFEYIFGNNESRALANSRVQ